MKQAWLVLGAVFVATSVALAGSASTDIDKFFRVDARVCTGGQPTHEQIATLKTEGVRGIIDLREPEEHDVAEEARLAKDLGLRYVNIPVKSAAPKDEQVATFLEATRDPDVFPVFIHCGSGNRVGSFWMIRRVLVDGWSSEKAEAEAKQIGLKSPNLVDFAHDYIQRHEKTSP